MIGMLKSEIYKLFTRRSFYVCGIILLALVAINVWTTEAQFCLQYGIEGGLDLKKFGFTGWDGIMRGLSLLSTWGIVISSIFSSTFVCSEFSSGMVKNFAVRGKNKFIMYFSKLIACLFVPIIYALLSVLVSYAIGAFLWSPGEWKDAYINSLLIPFGFFVLIQVVFQSISVMVGYIIESSGWSSGINFGLAIRLLPDLIIAGIGFVLQNWFGLKNIYVGKYWLGSFFEIYATRWPFEDEIISVLPWLLLAYLVIPSLIGSIVFSRREVK